MGHRKYWSDMPPTVHRPPQVRSYALPKHSPPVLNRPRPPYAPAATQSAPQTLPPCPQRVHSLLSSPVTAGCAAPRRVNRLPAPSPLTSSNIHLAWEKQTS